MPNENIIRAWKDTSFRDGLSDVERSLLPENPAGLMQLRDDQLNAAAGGAKPLTREQCSEDFCPGPGPGF
ncbi:MAG: mersacidin/lichenicidin family type 2 lantibiotic [Leptolyngbyaceae cyanobacterium SU_3_3]|nr:mersacidin/lichenicidin family type 2 lantibiotic [Leptolyngbyaceae cyanobacterium SU_3_3]